VALVGFDDIPLAHEMVPALTTVRIPLDQIGRRAARRVLQLIDSSRPDGARPDIIVPSSSAAPPPDPWSVAHR
jgi:LacI family transcriptional regulator